MISLAWLGCTICWWPRRGETVTIEDYALHRRPADGGARQPRRLDRLVLLPALRLGRLLRGAARRRPSTAAGCSRRPASVRAVDAPLPARHADPRVGSSRPTRAAVRAIDFMPPRGDGAGHRADRRGPRRRACRCARSSSIRFDYGHDRPVGAAGRRRARRDRRARTRSASARPVEVHGEDMTTVVGVHASGRASGSRSCSRGSRRTSRCPTRSTPSGRSPRPRSTGSTGPARCTHDGRLPRRDPPVAARAEGAHLRADRRHRRRADDVAARGDRRRAQLGLPLLLAPRRDAHAAGDAAAPATATRRRRGASGSCARSPATRPTLQIMYGIAGERRLDERELDWLPGLRGLDAGAGRQRRRRRSSSSTSTARCSTRCYQTRVHGAPADDNVWSLHAEAARVARGRLAASRTRASGRCAARPALHALEGDGVGRVRPRRPRARGVRPRGPGRALARAARRDPRRGARRAPGARSSRRSRSPTTRTSSTRASC